MGAGARQGQKAAVCQPGQIEFTTDKGGYRAGQKTVNRPGNDYRILYAGTCHFRPGLEKSEYHAKQFSQGDKTQQSPQLCQQ